jgi:hypothetical protein
MEAKKAEVRSQRLDGRVGITRILVANWFDRASAAGTIPELAAGR